MKAHLTAHDDVPAMSEPARLPLLDRLSAELLWDVLTSLKLTIVALAALMVLVVACTLAQVSMGTLGAVNAYIRSWFVWWHVPGTGFSIVVFPGGALTGLVLMVNLVAAQVKRLTLSWSKLGMWTIHAGLILLVAGEFVTSMMQTESRLSIQQGQTLNYVERPREVELAVTDTSARDADDVYAVPEPDLRQGGVVALPGTSISLNVKQYLPNSELRRKGVLDHPSMADRGIGPDVVAEQVPPVTNDDLINQPTVFVEPLVNGKSYGTWMVSTALGAPQSFMVDGHSYQLSMRMRREYLPYSITLEKFSHDVYPGTDIPKNFSSLVHISNSQTHEERDVLIYMNQPLRYAGKAFYQASFGRGDTLSILQVVENPGWLLPYVSCSLVILGLFIHFAISLRRGLRRSQTIANAPSGAGRPATAEA